MFSGIKQTAKLVNSKLMDLIMNVDDNVTREVTQENEVMKYI